MNAPAPTGGVQSVTRAFALLEELHTAGGPLSITQLAERTALPLGTIHRLAKTLAGGGYLRQLADRRYALGSGLAALGATASTQVGVRAQSVLEGLARVLGESANLAMLSDGSAEYIGQAAGSHSMRMFTEVGRKVPLHCTGVGKALLSQLPEAEVARIMRREGMAAVTPTTLTTIEAVFAEVERIRVQGFAMDEGEMEIGVRCIAMPFHAGAPMAVSVSGPEVRMTTELVARAESALHQAATDLAPLLDDRR